MNTKLSTFPRFLATLIFILVLSPEPAGFTLYGAESAAKPSGSEQVYTCSNGKTSVTLSWEPDEQTDYYIIYRKKADSGNFREIARVSDCTYTDRSIAYRQDYRYKIIPVAQCGDAPCQGASFVREYSNKPVVLTDHQKYSYTEMKKDIESLADKYHGQISYEILGTTADNRSIYDVVIGNPDAKKSLLVVSTIHAREYMASLLCMRQIEYYMANYNKKINGTKIADTLDDICIHYIPMANPDGVTLSQYGLKKIKNSSLRKNLRKMGASYGTTWKANARGVDLNYNFPYKFVSYGRPGSGGYHGKSALCEKETKAIVKLVNTLDPTLCGVVNYHAMGCIVFGSCSKSGKLKTNTQKMYNTARKVTGYADAAGYQGLPGFREYMIYKRKKPSITIEIGRSSCPGPIREFGAIWRENKDVVIREAMLFR